MASTMGERCYELCEMDTEICKPVMKHHVLIGFPVLAHHITGSISWICHADSNSRI
jgi:hypothetical protein